MSGYRLSPFVTCNVNVSFYFFVLFRVLLSSRVISTLVAVVTIGSLDV